LVRPRLTRNAHLFITGVLDDLSSTT
jgi:hypothetical protein